MLLKNNKSQIKSNSISVTSAHELIEEVNHQATSTTQTIIKPRSVSVINNSASTTCNIIYNSNNSNSNNNKNNINSDNRNFLQVNGSSIYGQYLINQRKKSLQAELEKN